MADPKKPEAGATRPEEPNPFQEALEEAHRVAIGAPRGQIAWDIGVLAYVTHAALAARKLATTPQADFLAELQSIARDEAAMEAELDKVDHPQPRPTGQGTRGDACADPSHCTGHLTVINYIAKLWSLARHVEDLLGVQQEVRTNLRVLAERVEVLEKRTEGLEAGVVAKTEVIASSVAANSANVIVGAS